MLKSIIVFVLVLAACQAAPIDETIGSFKPLRAYAEMHGVIVNKTTGVNSTVSGVVEFFQDEVEGPLKFKVNISFVPEFDGQENVWRGIHIHSKPVTNNTGIPSIDCGTTGPHFNPRNVTHGLLESEVHHNGDLGNVATLNGQILVEKESKFISLTGNNTILHRSVVLHERLDDGGLGTDPTSKLFGNAGVRIACGSIILRED